MYLQFFNSNSYILNQFRRNQKNSPDFGSARMHYSPLSQITSLERKKEITAYHSKCSSLYFFGSGGVEALFSVYYRGYPNPSLLMVRETHDIWVQIA